MPINDKQASALIVKVRPKTFFSIDIMHAFIFCYIYDKEFNSFIYVTMLFVGDISPHCIMKCHKAMTLSVSFDNVLF